MFAHRLSFAVNEIGMAFFFALMAQEVVEAVMPGGALHRGGDGPWPSSRRSAAWWEPWRSILGYVHLQLRGGMVARVAGRLRDRRRGDLLRAEDDHAAQRRRSPSRCWSRSSPTSIGLSSSRPDTSCSRPAPAARRSCSSRSAWRRPCALLKVRAFWPYLFICGTLSWLAFYWEGLHPAFALMPIVPFLPHEPRRVDSSSRTRRTMTRCITPSTSGT